MTGVDCCPHGLHRPAELIERLRRIPHGMFIIKTVGWCQLQAGHRGPHYSFGQASQELGSQWVRWNDAGITLVRLHKCPVAPSQDEACVLFTGHDGLHSFQIPPYETGDQDAYEET